MTALKRLSVIMASALSLLTGCTGSADSTQTGAVAGSTMTKITASGETVQLAQTGYTTDVPDEYFSASVQSGTVVEMNYGSKDYVRDESPVTKTAYVYLPYGYDENDTETRYDICYLMHGCGVLAASERSAFGLISCGKYIYGERRLPQGNAAVSGKFL